MRTFGSSRKAGLVRLFPFMVLALAAYHLAAATGHDFSRGVAKGGVELTLVSGTTLHADWNVALLVLGLFLLFMEILKSTRSTTNSTLEHILSVLVFMLFLVEFIVVPSCGTAVFGLLGLMSLMDLMAGYAISIAVARRDLNITE